MPRGKGWLALTPEPEHELPAAIAVLRAGGEPAPGSVSAERERARAIVLRGDERRYLAWLREAAELAGTAAGGEPAVDDARAVTLDVVSNQAGLLLGLPGGSRRRDAAQAALERVASSTTRTRNGVP